MFLLQVFFKTQIYTDLRRFQVAAVWIQDGVACFLYVRSCSRPAPHMMDTGFVYKVHPV